jgi:hypothetical protein
MPMQSSADTTPILRGDASLDHVVSHPIQPMIEEVVVLKQSSINPTLLLESEKSKEVTMLMKILPIPLFFWGLMHILTMSLAFLVLYLLNKGEFHSPQVRSLRVRSFLIMGFLWCIVYEGSFASILSSSPWKYFGSPKLVLDTSEMIAFERRTAWEPWPPPMGPSNMMFPLESYLVIFKTLSHGICETSSPSFMDVEFPSDEDILEAMILDFQPLPKLEASQFDCQRDPWPDPSNGLYLVK